VALLVAGALTAGCGARLDDDQLAAATAGQAATDVGGNVTGPRQVAGPAASTATTAAGGPAATGGPGGGPAAGPEGGAPAPEGQAAPGSTCTPDGASDVGIAPDSISLGQVGTISGPIPGLSQTAVNGVRAYIAYRNSQGGVCGRELQLVNGDDRLDAGQNRAEHARLAERVFGFVGGWSVADDGGAAFLQGTNIPDVGIAISESRFLLPNNFSSNPIDLEGGGTRTIFDYMVANYQVDSAGVVWGAQATARARAQGFIRDLEAMGIPVKVQREVAITETNYVPVAQEIENQGVDLVITALEMTGIGRLAQSFQQVGYQPAVPYYGAQSYGQRFLELAGDAADGTILGLTHPIVEDAGGGGILDEFVAWNERVNPGQEIDFFTFQGWVAADMFADAILAAGPAPTRDSVLEVLRTYTAFDADGLVASFNPAGKVGSPCYVIVTVEGGAWKRVHPASGFACP
jgi:ABC-type branched-subunit amino acid transport system substrate-binding protein